MRRIVRHLDEMSSSPHQYDQATALRLGVLRRRAAVRVEAAAEELARAAEARDAPGELRALARAVHAGHATWEQCVTGKADDLPAVRAWLGARPATVAPDEDMDADMDASPLRRD